MCYYCQKKGHYQNECPEKEQEEFNIANPTFKQKEEVELIMTMSIIDTLSTMWIANMAVFTHITNEETGLYTIKNDKELIKIGSGEIIHATKVGGWTCLSFKKMDIKWHLHSRIICYIPNFCIKPFTLMVAMSKGCDISSKDMMIVQKKCINATIWLQAKWEKCFCMQYQFRHKREKVNHAPRQHGIIAKMSGQLKK